MVLTVVRPENLRAQGVLTQAHFQQLTAGTTAPMSRRVNLTVHWVFSGHLGGNFGKRHAKPLGCVWDGLQEGGLDVCAPKSPAFGSRQSHTQVLHRARSHGRGGGGATSEGVGIIGMTRRSLLRPF